MRKYLLVFILFVLVSVRAQDYHERLAALYYVASMQGYINETDELEKNIVSQVSTTTFHYFVSISKKKLQASHLVLGAMANNVNVLRKDYPDLFFDPIEEVFQPGFKRKYDLKDSEYESFLKKYRIWIEDTKENSWSFFEN